MIPIFEAQILDQQDGIFKISLVDAPAVESNFLFFNKEDKALKFSIEDEEQHIVFGVLMRADYPIYRFSPQYGEYYIKYTKETIKKMAEKMLADNTHNNINLQHTDGTDVNDVHLVEVFIKDEANGISPVGFEHIEDGSLFTKYKVENAEIWQSIKDGTFQGFSLEGYFEINETGEMMRKTNKNKTNFMTKLSKKIMKAIVKFGSVKTDKGELYWVGEGQLEIGDELFIDEGEDRVKVEDGEYITEDETKITVTEGLVSAIEPKADEEPKNDPEPEQENEENDPEPANDPEPEAKANEKYDELKADIESLKAEIEALKAEIAELKKEPAAEPIMDQYEKVAKLHTNDSKINNAISIVSKLKK
jgi:hypothetical protein